MFLKLSLGTGTKICILHFLEEWFSKLYYRRAVFFIPERIYLLPILYSDWISRKYWLWWAIYVAKLATCKNNLLLVANPCEKIHFIDFTWRETDTESHDRKVRNANTCDHGVVREDLRNLIVFPSREYWMWHHHTAPKRKWNSPLQTNGERGLAVGTVYCILHLCMACTSVAYCFLTLD